MTDQPQDQASPPDPEPQGDNAGPQACTQAGPLRHGARNALMTLLGGAAGVAVIGALVIQFESKGLAGATRTGRLQLEQRQAELQREIEDRVRRGEWVDDRPPVHAARPRPACPDSELPPGQAQ